MSTKQQRRKWALEMAAALLRSDMDNFTVDGAKDEDEEDQYRAEIRVIADGLERRAKRIREQQ